MSLTPEQIAARDQQRTELFRQVNRVKYNTRSITKSLEEAKKRMCRLRKKSSIEAQQQLINDFQEQIRLNNVTIISLKQSIKDLVTPEERIAQAAREAAAREACLKSRLITSSSSHLSKCVSCPAMVGLLSTSGQCVDCTR